MTATLPPYQQLIESAKAIHQDNLDLLHRIAAGETDPGTYLDCTLNGAQYHIFDFFEALASFNYGEVPWRDTKFMLDSTNALVKAVEKKFPLPSAHAVGQALRSSQLWWCLDKPKAALSQKAYVKHLVSAREAIYDALNAFNRDLYTDKSPGAADGAAKIGKTHRSRNSLKGKKTKFMSRQLKTFKTFLVSKHYDGTERKLIALATQCWSTNRQTWEKAKSSAGENKGYSSPKVLADAYRKSQ